MPLKITKLEITDSLDSLARTGKVLLASAEPETAPSIEYAANGEIAHFVSTTLRPDEEVTLYARTTNGTRVPVVKGLVEHVDDLTDPDKRFAPIELSEVPVGRQHKERVTMIWNDPDDYTSIGGAIKGNPDGGGYLSAHSIIRDFAALVGIGVGPLDFPDYRIVGNFAAVNETIVDVANQLIAPFNVFDYLHFVVRMNSHEITVVRLDYTQRRLAPPYQISNVLSRTRRFEAYMPDARIGSAPILLVGGTYWKRSKAAPSLDTGQIRIPKEDDPTQGSSYAQFQLTAYVQEIKVTDTTTSRSGQNQGDSLLDALNTPAHTEQTETNTIFTYLLVTGYGSEVESYAASLTTAKTQLANYVSFFENSNDATLRGHVAADYDYTALTYPGGEQAYLDWLNGLVVQRFNKAISDYQTVTKLLDKVNVIAVNPSLSALGLPSYTSLSLGQGLYTADPADVKLDYTYDESGQPVSVSQSPTVVYGEVAYVTGLSSLGQGTSLSVSRVTSPDFEGGIFGVREERTVNEYVIAEIKHRRQLFLKSSVRETWHEDGAERALDERDVTSTTYNSLGEAVASQTAHYKGYRGTLVFYDVSTSSSATPHLEYALARLSDQSLALRATQNDQELTDARFDLAMTQRKQRADSQRRAYEERQARARTNNYEQHGQYRLLDGRIIDPEDFHTQAFPQPLFIDPNITVIPIGENLPISAVKGQLGKDLKRAFKREVSNMEYNGLQQLWRICAREREIEQIGAYWETVEISMPLDPNIYIGLEIYDDGSRGIVVDVHTEIDDNRATTDVTYRHLVPKRALTPRSVFVADPSYSPQDRLNSENTYTKLADMTARLTNGQRA